VTHLGSTQYSHEDYHVQNLDVCQLAIAARQSRSFRRNRSPLGYFGGRPSQEVTPYTFTSDLYYLALLETEQFIYLHQSVYIEHPRYSVASPCHHSARAFHHHMCTFLPSQEIPRDERAREHADSNTTSHLPSDSAERAHIKHPAQSHELCVHTRNRCNL
jgi:hypothetical protein